MELAKFSLSISLLDGPLPAPWDFGEATRKINGDVLHPSAFERMAFMVSLEKGESFTQFDRQFDAAYLYSPYRGKFGFDLVCEPSLLPGELDGKRERDWEGNTGSGRSFAGAQEGKKMRRKRVRNASCADGMPGSFTAGHRS